MLKPHQANYTAHDQTAQHGGGALPVAWPHVLENAPTVEIREVAKLFIADFALSSATLETGLEDTKETPEKHQGTILRHLLQHPQASVP